MSDSDCGNSSHNRRDGRNKFIYIVIIVLLKPTVIVVIIVIIVGMAEINLYF